jgi:branched-chain amino acid transport system ATP-binding protein
MGIGRTFQLVKPFGNISLVKNTMVGTFCRARNKQEAAEEALRVLEFVGLYDKRDNLARSLTIGDRKKLELARALAVGPSLLLLDEILAGLNPAEVEEALQLISTIRNNGVTVLMIEHVMQAVMQLSDHVIVLHEGKKIAEGSPKQVVSDERVIKAYLGEEYVIS